MEEKGTDDPIIRGTSSAGRVDIYEPAKVLWVGCVEDIMCNGDDLILDALFDSTLSE